MRNLIIKKKKEIQDDIETLNEAEDVEMEEEAEKEISLDKRRSLVDRKVLERQMRWEQEEEDWNAKLDSKKRKKKDKEYFDDTNKRKMKNKNKALKKKKKPLSDVFNSSIDDIKHWCRVIDGRYKQSLRDMNLDIKDFLIYPVPGGGLCGPSVLAAHCYDDPSLGRFVRRHVNKHKSNLWSFYGLEYTFPYSAKLGAGSFTFENGR